MYRLIVGKNIPRKKRDVCLGKLTFHETNTCRRRFGTMRYLSIVLREINSFLFSLDPSGWAVIAVIIVGAGVLCMRGYGPRDTY